jgi:hypothetical protein
MSEVAMNEIFKPESSMVRFRIALILAIVADVLQIALLPMFVEGAASPADDALDAGVGIALIALLGCTGNLRHRSLASSCRALI